MSNEAAVASAGEVTLQKIIDGEATVNDLIGLGEPQIQAIAVLGFQAYEQGRGDEARAIFEGLTALDSSSYFGYAGLGAMALADGDLAVVFGVGSQRLPQPPIGRRCGQRPAVVSRPGVVGRGRGHEQRSGHHRGAGGIFANRLEHRFIPLAHDAGVRGGNEADGKRGRQGGSKYSSTHAGIPL